MYIQEDRGEKHTMRRQIPLLLSSQNEDGWDIKESVTRRGHPCVDIRNLLDTVILVG